MILLPDVWIDMKTGRGATGVTLTSTGELAVSIASLMEVTAETT
jgi:hypothetical protein